MVGIASSYCLADESLISEDELGNLFPLHYNAFPSNLAEEESTNRQQSETRKSMRFDEI
jgi:hypothetical protein